MATKLKDVFTPGGQPSITYVGREHLSLENSVLKALKQGYALTVVTGPTKSGKTVLCSRVLESNGAYVTVQGGQVRTEQDFWKHLAHRLQVRSSRALVNNEVVTSQVVGELSGGIPGIVGAKGAYTDGEQTQTSKSEQFEEVAVLSVLEKMKAEDITLLVDDFHYIHQDVQKSIIQALKSPIFDGLSVIFLAVPHRAFDPITVEDEMQGRFRHIPIPPWSQDDLILIPRQGFSALNVVCPDGLAERICLESFSNPLLVQEICSEMCAHEGIYEFSEEKKRLNPDALELTLQSVAESKGFPKYRRLREGPQSRTDRMARHLKSGGSADIYEAILMALAKLGPRPRTQYDELRAAMRDLIEEGQVPQKHEVTAALSQMSRIAQEKIEGEPPLEFVKDEDALVITDPFLLFYMKWQKNKVAPGSHLA